MTERGGPGAPMVTVQVLGLPLAVFARASEHSDELLREFALVRTENSDHVPSRLLALIDALQSRFGGFTEAPTTAIQEALDGATPRSTSATRFRPTSPTVLSGWRHCSTRPTSSAGPVTS